MSSTYRATVEADRQLLYVTRDPKMATVWEVRGLGQEGVMTWVTNV
jgi:hypothetical protein